MLKEIRNQFQKISENSDCGSQIIPEYVIRHQDPEALPDKFPLLWLYDKETGEEHLYGTDIHDSLCLDMQGQVSYYNYQNGEGTGEDGDYLFIDHSDSEGEGSVLEISTDAIRTRILGEVIEKLEYEAVHDKGIGRKQCEGMAKAINIVRSFLPNEHRK